MPFFSITSQGLVILLLGPPLQRDWRDVHQRDFGRGRCCWFHRWMKKLSNLFSCFFCVCHESLRRDRNRFFFSFPVCLVWFSFPTYSKHNSFSLKRNVQLLYKCIVGSMKQNPLSMGPPTMQPGGETEQTANFPSSLHFLLSLWHFFFEIRPFDREGGLSRELFSFLPPFIPLLVANPKDFFRPLHVTEKCIFQDFPLSQKKSPLLEYVNPPRRQ